MILKEQGQPVPDELSMNSWEMVDLIIKNIHLVDIEVRNLRKQCKQYEQEKVTRSERIFEAIDAFYAAKKN